MNYEEKIRNSVIVRRTTRNKTREGISTKDKRVKGIIYFILLALYTIYSNIILKNVTQLSATLILILINLATFCLLTFINKSIFSKNHITIYKIVKFINKACKVLIFMVTLSGYSEFFVEVFHEFEPYITNNIIDDKVLFDMFKYSPIKWISFLVSVIIAIPHFIYFFILYIKVIPPLGIIYYFIWLFRNPREFKEYEEKDDKKVNIITRRINIRGYGIKSFMKKIGFTILAILFITLALAPILQSISKLIKVLF